MDVVEVAVILVVLVGVVVMVEVTCVSKHEQTSPTSEDARDTMLDQIDSFGLMVDVVVLVVVLLLVLDDLLVLNDLLVLDVFEVEEVVDFFAYSCLLLLYTVVVPEGSTEVCVKYSVGSTVYVNLSQRQWSCMP